MTNTIKHLDMTAIRADLVTIRNSFNEIDANAFITELNTPEFVGNMLEQLEKGFDHAIVNNNPNGSVIDVEIHNRLSSLGYDDESLKSNSGLRNMILNNFKHSIRSIFTNFEYASDRHLCYAYLLAVGAGHVETTESLMKTVNIYVKNMMMFYMIDAIDDVEVTQAIEDIRVKHNLTPLEFTEALA